MLYGFHAGPHGGAANHNGIGNFYKEQARLGQAIVCKSTDNFGHCFEAAQVAKDTGADHHIIFRLTTDRAVYDFDVPPYHLPPVEAAQEHFQATIDRLPPEYWDVKDMVWIEPINEIDKNRQMFLAGFIMEWSRLAKEKGMKISMFGWSSGEPEVEDWAYYYEYLKLCSEDPEHYSLSLHEYSYVVSSLMDRYPYLLGRSLYINAYCEAVGLNPPTIYLTEFGWTLNKIPAKFEALKQLREFKGLYDSHPNIKAAYIWCLQNGGGNWNPIQNQVAGLIPEMAKVNQQFEPRPTPVLEITKIINKHNQLHGTATDPQPVEPPTVEPPVVDPVEPPSDRPNYKVTVNVVPIQFYIDGRLPKLIGLITPGQDIVQSVDSAGRLVMSGTPDSELIVWNGNEIGTGLTAEWFIENGYKIPNYLSKNFETEYKKSQFPYPTDFRLKNSFLPPTAVVTQMFGVNPQNYEQFGLPGHEGIDMAGVPIRTPVRAVADGTVRLADTNPAGNYGIHIRLDHVDDIVTIYAHMDSLHPSMVEGREVKAGEVIAFMGNTGRSTGPHVHFGMQMLQYMYVDGNGQEWPNNFIDPTPFLDEVIPESAYRGFRRWPIGEVIPTGAVVPKPPVVTPMPKPPVVELPYREPEPGIHDEAGGDWMRARGYQGWSLHSIVSRKPTRINFDHFKNAGIKMLVRLNWGYYPDGTFPPEQNEEQYINACVETIKSSTGVWGWVIGNEFNNPNEWVGGQDYSIQRILRVYNEIARRLEGNDQRITIGAIDPYFGPGSDNRSYWKALMDGADRMDFLTYHPKTQGSDPNLIDSNVKFSNDPLRWQFLHFKSFIPLLSVSDKWLDAENPIPIILTEVNPQRKSMNGTGNVLGWNPNTSREWVKQCREWLEKWNKNNRQLQVDGYIFYRYDFDEWRLRTQESTLHEMFK